MSLSNLYRRYADPAAERATLSRRLVPYLLLIPATLWLGLIYLYPLARTVYLSFMEASLAQPAAAFVGFDNYVTALTGPFVETIVRTAVWTLGSVIPAILLGISGAILLKDDFIGKRFVVSGILIPWTMPMAIVAFIWLMMYNPQIGMLPGLLALVNVEVSFLGTDNALYSVIVARIWRATPFALVIFYARLQSIPSHLYEAAQVDGAGRWSQFRYITLPELTRVLTITLILLTVWTTLVFDLIYAMTGGGPAGATMIIPIEIYQTTFQRFDLGLAAAQSMITVLFLIVMTVLYWRVADL